MHKVKLLKTKPSIALLSLYYWTKCLGINPLLLSKSGDLRLTRFGIFYNCFLSTIFCYVFYEITKTRLHMRLINEAAISAILDYIGLLLQFHENLSTWFIFGIFQKRTIRLIKNFIKIEKLADQIETPNNYRVQSNQIVCYLFIVNFLYSTSIIISNSMFSFWPDYEVTVWIVFYVPTLASYNVSMLYLLGFLIVKRKFRFLNKKLRDLVNIERRNNSRGSKAIVSYDALGNELMMISQLHRELRNIVDLMEEHMGLPVLLNIGINFVYLTITLYSCYRHFTPLESSMAIPTSVFMIAVSHWIARPIMMFLLISKVCGSTLEEANNAGNFLHASLNNCQVHEKSRKYSMQLSIFSLDLLNNRLNISIHGFFKLDHFFFYSLIATSTSYLVIMHQLTT